jgi:hypothetical protein
MNQVFTGVRRGDALLAVLLTGLGVLLMVMNIVGEEPGTRIDSRSWLLVPVFAAATVPILWRRRSMLAVLVVSAAAMAAHVAAFGWVVRCGAGLPLSFALAYGAGRLLRGPSSWIGLALALATQVLVLVRDSAAGLGITPVTALVAATCWGAGVLFARRETGAPVPAAAAAARV